MKNLRYTVTKDNKPQFRGSDFDCFEYILKHQTNSVDYATKHAGWAIEKTSLEGLIIEACLLEEGFESATIGQALVNATKRFHSEYSWHISKQGRLKACEEWLAGLALNVPYWNNEIEEMGLNSETYFRDLAKAFLSLTYNQWLPFEVPTQKLFDAVEAL